MRTRASCELDATLDLGVDLARVFEFRASLSALSDDDASFVIGIQDKAEDRKCLKRE